MISVGYKKQLIINYYKTQLLSDSDEIHTNFIGSNKRIQNLLLFKRDNKSSWIIYKFKFNNIEYNIRWFLDYLIDPIYYKTNIQKNISSNIESTLEYKQNIEDNPDYTEYLEDIYDK
jgi:hypothetical protein